MAAVASADIIATNLIEVVFSVSMKNDAALTSVDNYTVIVSGGTVELTIKRVLSGASDSTLAVLLEVSQPVIGTTYLVTVDRTSAIRSAADVQIGVGTDDAKVIARITKTDGMLHKYQILYDLSPGANIHSILTAIGSEDDKIGGDRDDNF